MEFRWRGLPSGRMGGISRDHLAPILERLEPRLLLSTLIASADFTQAVVPTYNLDLFVNYMQYRGASHPEGPGWTMVSPGNSIVQAEAPFPLDQHVEIRVKHRSSPAAGEEAYSPVDVVLTNYLPLPEGGYQTYPLVHNWDPTHSAIWQEESILFEAGELWPMPGAVRSAVTLTLDPAATADYQVQSLEFHVVPGPSAPLEPNEDRAAAADLGAITGYRTWRGSVRGCPQIAGSADVDWYRFELPEDGAPGSFAEVDCFLDPTAAPLVELHDGGGNLLETGQTTGFGLSEVPLHDCPAGTYFLRVAGTEAFHYALTINATAISGQGPLSLMLEPGSDSGVSDQDGITRIATPTIEIAGAQEGDTVRIYRSGNRVGEARHVGGGAYAYTFAAGELVEGDNILTARLVEGEAEGPDSPPLTITLDTTGPRAVGSSGTQPIDLGAGPVQDAYVRFDEAVDLATAGEGFGLEDVAIRGPEGEIAPTGIQAAGPNEYRITFDPQTARGRYDVAVGPGLIDLAGNPMDQDGDGTGGEAGQDVYTFSLSAFDPAMTVTFAGPATIDPDDTSYRDMDVIVLGTTLTVDGPHAFNSLTVLDGGVVTHTAGSEDGLDLDIAEGVLIDAASAISADGRGYAAGPGAGIASSGVSGGGGYGGAGGDGLGGHVGGPTYGSVTAPVDLGSGERYGTPGGGAIRLAVGGTLTVAGSLTAVGADGTGNHGGGSGGSVYLTVGMLAGDGVILADGGDSLGSGGETDGGGGGGGRIALYCDASAFTGTVSARGGAGLQAGGAGTVFTKLPGREWGDLWIDNGPAAGAATTLLSEPARLDSLVLGSGSIVDLTVALRTDDLQVASGAELSHPSEQEGGLELTVTGDAVIEAGGRVTADARGYAAGPGRGSGSNNLSGGGGYGGMGGQAGGGRGGGPSYGSVAAPVHLGSGDVYGTPGGGAIRLTVGGTLTVAGSLTAVGADGAESHGGGSGGSVYLTVGTLTGGGVISADGGDSLGSGVGETDGGGGGGGRIALYVDADAFTGTVSARGGAGLQAGGAGTVFTKLSGQEWGDLWIDNGGGAEAATTLLSKPARLDSLEIGGGSIVSLTDLVTTDAFELASGAVLTHPAEREGGLELTVTGDAVIEAGGRVTADALGYARGPGRSSGTGGISGGGGYGGAGGDGAGGRTGGATYGSITAPVELGSGEAYGLAPGGGAIRLIVGGTLTVAGSVTARGADGPGHYGGGSGGSVCLTVGTLAGGGVISADGGDSLGPVGGETEGGGGGGGRIALYYHDRSGFVGSITAGGGTGINPGGCGTIHLGELQGPNVRSAVLGRSAEGVDRLEVTFNEAIDPASFDGSDVVLSIPGGTELALTDPPTLVAGNTWRLTFPPQPYAGEYRVAVGPHVADPGGHELDQDLDLIEGEADDDVYRGVFLVAAGLIAADAFEPNDTRSEATDLGRLEGTWAWPGLSVHEAGNEDWYAFEMVEAGGEGHLAGIDFQHALGDLDLQLLDEQGHSLVHATGVVNGEAIPLGSRPAGRYYLRVHGAAGATSPAYTLILSTPRRETDPDGFEPNDSREAAANLGIVRGTQVWDELSVHYTGNDDWYRFEAVAPGRAEDSVRIDFHHADGNLGMGLHDAEGALLRTADGTTDAEEVSLAGREPGVYYVRVYGAQGNTNAAYTLTIAGPEPAADALEPNDDPATATNLGPLEGEQSWPGLSIHPTGDQDWFRFETSRGGAKDDFVRIDFRHDLGDLDLRLFDEQGGHLASSTTVLDREELSLADRPAGVYYLQVAGFDGATNGQYLLTVNAPEPGDRFEANDHIETATDLGLVEGESAWQGLSIHSEDDVDYLRFEIEAGAAKGHFVRAEFDPALGDVDLALLGGDGHLLEQSRTEAGVEEVSLARYPSGSYFVVVSCYEGANPDYTLTVNGPQSGIGPDRFEPNEDMDTATDLGVVTGTDSWADLSIHGTTEVDTFRFETVDEAVATNYVRIDFVHAQGDLDLYLFDEQGQMIGRSEGVTDGERVSLSGLDAGVFYALVGSYNEANPAYSLTIDAPVESVEPDRFEPNDALATPADLGEVHGAREWDALTVHQPGDEDWYRFEIAQAGPGHAASISFDQRLGDLDLSLYDAGGDPVAESATSRGTETVSLAHLPAGAYYLKVEGARGATNESYVLSIDAPGEIPPDWAESNDAAIEAYDLRQPSAGSTWGDLTIHDADDVDWFRLQTTHTGRAGDYVGIQFCQSQGDLDLYLYGADGVTLAGRSETTNDREQVDLLGLDAGVYFVQVVGHDGAVSPRYELVVEPPAPSAIPEDDFEQNDSMAQAADLRELKGGRHVFSGLTMDNSANEPMREDWFQFTIVRDAGPAHAARIDFQHGAGDLDLALYRPDGQEIGASATAGNQEVVSLAHLAAGTYLLKVAGHDNAANPGYTLTIDAPTDEIPPDWAESNDTPADAYDLRKVQGSQTWDKLTVHGPADADWFRFELAAAGSVGHSVAIDFAHSEGDLDLSLYGADGTALLGTCETVGDRETISLNGRGAGTYFVKVAGREEAVSPGYALTIQAPPGDTQIPEDDYEQNDSLAEAYDLRTVVGHGHVYGLTMDDSENEPAREDWFRFTTAAEGKVADLVRIEFDPTRGDLEMALCDANGAVLDSAVGHGGMECIDLEALPTGTYYLKVYGRDNATNPSYVLTLSAPTPAVIPEDECEQNDGPGQPWDLKEVQGRLVVDGLTIDASDVGSTVGDWFRFTTVADCTWTDGVTLQRDPDLDRIAMFVFELVGHEMIMLGSSADSPSPDEKRVSLAGLPANTYWIWVVALETIPWYRLTIDAPVPQTGVPEDASEDNDSAEHAYDLRELVGAGHVFDDLTMDDSPQEPLREDWFRFETVAQGGEGDAVQIHFVHARGNLDLEIYDAAALAAGSPLASSAGQGDSERVSLAGRPAGVYHVRVLGRDNATNPDYTLVVHAPDDPAKLPEWTVLAYLNGDNNQPNEFSSKPNSTERGSYIKVKDMEGQAPSPLVQAGVLFDRIDGFVETVPDWADTRMGVLGYDPAAGVWYPYPAGGTFATEFLHAEERSIGDSATLAEFLQWAKATIPAKHYALFNFGHGAGFMGQGNDYTNDSDGLRSEEIAAALAASDMHLDILVLDGCLMGNIEAAYEVREHVDYVLGSGDSMWLPGIAYDQVLALLAERAGAEPDEIAAELVKQLAPGWSYTGHQSFNMLTAVETAGFGTLADRLRDFVSAAEQSATPADLTALLAARNHARGYCPGNLLYSNYRDLGTFLAAVAGSVATAQIADAAAAALDAYEATIVAHKTIPGYKDTTGFSVFLPCDECLLNILGSDLIGYPSLGFAADTGWADLAELLAQAPDDAAIPLDAAENNDTKWSARDLGTLTGEGLRYPGLSIHKPSDEDWFCVTTTVRGRPKSQIALDYPTESGQLGLFLYDDTSAEPLATGTATSEGVSVSLDGLPAGKYYFRIVGKPAGENPGVLPSYAMVLNLPGDWLIDWTETGWEDPQAFAPALQTGGLPVQGLSLTEGDEDWFQVLAAGPWGTTLHVHLGCDPSQGEVAMDLCDSEGQWLVSATPEAGGLGIAVPDAAGSSYYVKVSGEPVGEGIAYQLQVTETGEGLLAELLPPHVVDVLRDDGEESPATLRTLTFTFSEDVAVAADALTIHNDTWNEDVTLPQDVPFRYDAGTCTARWDLRGLVLPASRYTATLTAAAVEGDGELLDGDFDGLAGDDYGLSLLVTYPGDADLDGAVGRSDKLILQAHFGLAGDARWTDGDFNGDRIVDDGDYLLYKLHRGMALPPATPPAPAISEAGQTDENVPAAASRYESTVTVYWHGTAVPVAAPWGVATSAVAPSAGAPALSAAETPQAGGEPEGRYLGSLSLLELAGAADRLAPALGPSVGEAATEQTETANEAGVAAPVAIALAGPTTEPFDLLRLPALGVLGSPL